MKRFLLSAVLIAGYLSLCFAQHFSPVWSGNGLNHMNFNVNSATIDGVACAAGDEIAVFDGSLCVGVQVVTVPGEIVYVVTSKDDPVTPLDIDGFTAGQTATIRIWDASESREITDATIDLISGTLVFEDGATTWLNLTASTPCIPPSAPVAGTLTQPGCLIQTGSVELTGLPASGNWTLTRTPGGITYPGSGTSYTITGLPAGITYTFTVTNAQNCTSPSSAGIEIDEAPPVPVAPVPGIIVQPDCLKDTGSVVLSELPAAGWTLTRTPGGVTYTGSGAVYTVTGLPDHETYTFTVSNTAGCTSLPSTGVVINEQPATPVAPVVGTITQPTCLVPSGSVVLGGLPQNGTWTLTRTPGGTLSTGSGSETTVTGLPAGNTYTFTVTSAAGCTSLSSTGIVIGDALSIPSQPIPGEITQPDCQTGTGSVVLSGLPTTGTWTLTRSPGGNTYAGSGSSYTVSGLPDDRTFRFTVTNADGCTSLPSSAVVIEEQPPTPAAPTRGTVTQPTCLVNTGRVVLTGLPSDGTWTLTRMPGGITVNGSGSSYTVTGLPAGNTYTFTVTNNAGCTSPSTSGIEIQNLPPTPVQPIPGAITQPDCQTGTGRVVLSGLPASGGWTLTRTPGGNTYTGAGTTYTVTGLPDGNTYTFTVTNASGCTSASSTGVAINVQPATPSAPVTGTITQPTCQTTSGSVALSGLPATGGWTLTRSPGGITQIGSGSSYTVTGLPQGNTYTFTVTSASGCTSPSSAGVTINDHGGIPVPPSVGNITQPTCAVSTGSVTLTSLPSQGSWTLTRSPGGIPLTGSGSSAVISGLAAGTYTFTITNFSGCTSGSSSAVVIQARTLPNPPAVGTITQPTCATATGSVVLGSLPATGAWTLTRNPGGFITNGSGTSTTVSGLVSGTYTFTVTGSSGCTSASSGDVVINRQPIPSAPVPGTITQPNCQLNTGSVIISGLPSTGTWTLTRTPGGTTTTGSGTRTTVSGIPSGIYMFTVTNASGCVSSPSSQVILQEVTDKPAPPVAGAITQPSCTSATGEIQLVGLPGTGTWTLTRTPGNITYTGKGSSYTVKGLPASTTYTFTLTNASGCRSSESAPINLNSQPVVPGKPVPGTAIQPTCAVPAGSVMLTGLPSGNWTLARYPGGAITPGNGTGFMVSDLNSGTYTFTVTHASGCTSSTSASVVIASQPAAPAAPSVGTITQPTCVVNSGSVRLAGLPSGNWILKRYPGGHAISGSGSSTTVSGLLPGTHTFTITDAGGCTSANSAAVVIEENPLHPSAPVPATVNQPTCGTATGSITFTGLPGTGTWTLVSAPGGTIGTGNGSSATIANLKPDTYTFQVTNASGCTSGVSPEVIIYPQPPTPDVPRIDNVQHPTVYGTGSLVLKGLPSEGGWLVTRNPGGFVTAGNGDTLFVDNLGEGTYRFTVTNDQGCNSPDTSVTLMIVTGLPGDHSDDFRLYPNPVKDHFTVEFTTRHTGNARVELTSVHGSVFSVTEQEITEGKLVIDAGDVPHGMYLLRITAGSEVRQFRFVKE